MDNEIYIGISIISIIVIIFIGCAFYFQNELFDFTDNIFQTENFEIINEIKDPTWLTNKSFRAVSLLKIDIDGKDESAIFVTANDPQNSKILIYENDSLVNKIKNYPKILDFLDDKPVYSSLTYNNKLALFMKNKNLLFNENLDKVKEEKTTNLAPILILSDSNKDEDVKKIYSNSIIHPNFMFNYIKNNSSNLNEFKKLQIAISDKVSRNYLLTDGKYIFESETNLNEKKKLDSSIENLPPMVAKLILNKQKIKTSLIGEKIEYQPVNLIHPPIGYISDLNIKEIDIRIFLAYCNKIPKYKKSFTPFVNIYLPAVVINKGIYQKGDYWPINKIEIEYKDWDFDFNKLKSSDVTNKKVSLNIANYIEGQVLYKINLPDALIFEKIKINLISEKKIIPIETYSAEINSTFYLI